MARISWVQFHQTAQKGLLSPGDILFLSDHHGSITHRIINAGQKSRSLLSLGDRDNDIVSPHYRICHSATVTQKYDGYGEISIAEQIKSGTHIISTDQFYQDRYTNEMFIFRCNITIFTSWLSYFSNYYAKIFFPYVTLTENILSAFPRRNKNNALSDVLPDRLNCSSFVMLVYNSAIQKIRETNPYIYIPIKPIGYKEISPISLYHELKKRSETEGSWRFVHHIVPVNSI